MYAMETSTSWFGARMVVASLAALVLLGLAVQADAQSSDGCKVECYPNTKMINGKGAKSDNCRWILRTDGKAARLCDHIKCKKVCPANQAQQDQQEAASSPASDNLRIEQRTESETGASAGAGEFMGIMRQLHGNKLAKAPVPGVQGGRLSPAATSSGHSSGANSGAGRRMAPTLAPSVQYDENDTPPPISRFLDISPEE